MYVQQQEDMLQTDVLTPEFNMYIQQQEDMLQTDELTPEFKTITHLVSVTSEMQH